MPSLSRSYPFIRLCTPKLPDHAHQFVSEETPDLRYIVCHDVPRCTRPSQPMLGNLLVGNCHASLPVMRGSFA